MSRHIFKQAVDQVYYLIQIGWDKPCQRYYGVVMQWVEEVQETEAGYFDDENPVWSNLFFDHDFSLEEIAAECSKLGIKVPHGLLENVREDKSRNAVNLLKFYYT